MRQERYLDADGKWTWRDKKEDQEVKQEAEKVEASLAEQKAPSAPAEKPKKQKHK